MAAFSGSEFLTATPEAQGLSSRAIARALRSIEQSGKDIHSMLLMRRGRLVFEHYFAPYGPGTRHAMYSCSKTFTAMTIGIAQDRGLIRLSDKVLSFFPDVPVAQRGDNLAAMTIRDLLVMGSGHGEDTFGYMLDDPDGDWVRVFLGRPVDHAPGAHFVYNTGATYMLSAILQRVTGRTLHDLAEEWLFSKLGIRDTVWDACPRGITMGGTGLHLVPRDMARMGWMLLNFGDFDGERVVPEHYVREAARRQIDNGNPSDPGQNPNWASGYGYQMWRCAFDAFRADGMGGQYIVMVPGQELVAVFTSGLGGDIGFPLDVLAEHILPALSDASLPPDPEGAGELARLAARLHRPTPGAMPAEAASLPWGQKIEFEPNDLKLADLILDQGELRATLDGEQLLVKFAWGAPVIHAENTFSFHRRVPGLPISGMAWWEDGLRLRINFVGQPLTLNLRLYFEGDRAHLSVANTMAGEGAASGRVVG
ncbi:MAG: beta-lactamase family protein [Clostridiales bacterium]|nr:beta-lactamase family protein [Clostridiales bacterium]